MNTTLEDFPATDQRVRMILETPKGRTAQVPVSIVSIGDDHSIAVRVVAREAGIEFDSGMGVTLEYVRSGAVYRLVSAVNNIEAAEQGGSVLFLTPPKDVKKIQRRDNTRLYVSMPVQFTLVTDPSVSAADALSGDGPKFNGMVRQVGPGGVGLITDLAFGEGDVVALSLTLDSELLTFVGKVVWAGGPERLGNAGGGDFSHAVGLQFMDVTPETQSALDDFIIIELERRQKLQL